MVDLRCTSVPNNETVAKKLSEAQLRGFVIEHM